MQLLRKRKREKGRKAVEHMNEIGWPIFMFLFEKDTDFVCIVILLNVNRTFS